MYDYFLKWNQGIKQSCCDSKSLCADEVIRYFVELQQHEILDNKEMMGIGLKAGWMELAVKGSHNDLIDWCYKHGFVIFGDNSICIYAARYGNLEILKWMQKHAVELFKIDDKVREEAYKNGDGKILEWISQVTIEQRSNATPTSAITAEKAEAARQTTTITNPPKPPSGGEFASEKDEEDWKKLTDRWFSSKPEFINTVSRAGNIHWRTQICRLAALNSEFEVFKWCLQFKMFRNNTEHNAREIVMACVENGNLEFLKFVLSEIDKGLIYDWRKDHWVTTIAASRGHFSMLKWLFNEGCGVMPLNKLACYWTVENKRWKILKWLLFKECPIELAECRRRITSDRNKVRFERIVRIHEIVKELKERGPGI